MDGPHATEERAGDAACGIHPSDVHRKRKKSSASRGLLCAVVADNTMVSPSK